MIAIMSTKKTIILILTSATITATGMARNFSQARRVAAPAAGRVPPDGVWYRVGSNWNQILTPLAADPDYGYLHDDVVENRQNGFSIPPGNLLELISIRALFYD